MERLATILLPNSVAAHDTRRDVMDGRAKLVKENNTPRNGPSPAGMAANFECGASKAELIVRSEPRSGWQALPVLRWPRRPRAYVVALSAGTSRAPPPYRYFNLRERPSNRRRHAERELTVQPVAKSAHAFMSSLRALTRVDRWYARSTASPTAWDNAISASSLG